MNRTLVTIASAILLPLGQTGCASALIASRAAETSELSLAQLADLDEAGRVSLRRDSQRTVAQSHGASSIYDTAHFRGCPEASEVQGLARIDSVADDLNVHAAQAALDQAHLAITRLNSDLVSGNLRDHPTLSRAAEFKTAARDASDPEIAELLRRAARDQYLRGVSSTILLDGQPANPAVVERVFLRLKWPIVCESDASNAAWLEEAMARRVWFLRGTDGELAASAAWLFAQHADAFTDLQRKVLERMEPLVASGEIAASQYAYLYDRVGLATSGRQRFGTQMYCAGPQDWRPRPLEEPAQLDRLREEVQLPPMAEYAARGARFCEATDEEL